jgi:hypothetical protein
MIAGPDPIREQRCVCGRRRIDVDEDAEDDAASLYALSQGRMFGYLSRR